MTSITNNMCWVCPIMGDEPRVRGYTKNGEHVENRLELQTKSRYHGDLQDPKTENFCKNLPKGADAVTLFFPLFHSWSIFPTLCVQSYIPESVQYPTTVVTAFGTGRYRTIGTVN
jgi:hypothetical protein